LALPFFLDDYAISCVEY